MSRALRFAIATGGRFHMADLARELHGLGHDVQFHSFVPWLQLRRYGVASGAHCGLLSRVWPLLVMRKIVRGEKARRRFEHFLAQALDRHVARRLKPCDVFIGMAGLFLEAGLVAQKRYGALFVLERGSRHILSQREILDARSDRDSPYSAVPDFYVERNLAAYAQADLICVPSRQAELSFIERQVTPDKVFRNPYGVDLSLFPPTEAPPADAPDTVLYVGAWTWQKGVDLLVKAWESLKSVHLLHVGAPGDVPMPDHPRFRHIDPVPQWKLVDYYRKGRVFALASRQEGMALVQAQALACGLPVVCTDRTGGDDLKEMIAVPSFVTVVPHDHVPSLAAGIQSALARARRQYGMRDGLGRVRDELSWRAFARRYVEKVTLLRGGRVNSTWAGQTS